MPNRFTSSMLLLRSFFVIGCFASLVMLAGCNSDSANLSEATGDGDIDSMKSLIRSNPDLLNLPDSHGEAPLHVAVKQGQLDAVKALLEMEANPDVLSEPGQNTPLHYAVDLGDPEYVFAILSYQADVAIKNADGKDVVEYARSQTGDQSQRILELLEAAAK